jgi:hypothetical protein
MTSLPDPETDLLRAGITQALEQLADKKPGRAAYTLTRALLQADKAAESG